MESGLNKELGEPELGGLVADPPELELLLLLLLPLLLPPQLESTDGTLTKAETSEDRVELQASNDAMRCFQHTDTPHRALTY